MYRGVWFPWFLIFCLLTTDVVVCELISTGIAAVSAVAFSSFLAGYGYFKCKYYECCDDQWIPANIPGLKSDLQTRLYGQHLVIDTVVRALRGHLSNKNPKKALTLSFHGWTGGGKNYVSKMIADNLYKKGMKSQYVHLFISSFHFPHAQKVDEYKTRVRESAGDVSAEVASFSNTGGNDITQRTLEHWQKGNLRESIQLPEMEEIITVAAFNEEGGLRFSHLISSHMIDHFIPFLPLERSHVKLCIADHFKWKNLSAPTDAVTRRILDMLQYFPKQSRMFSASGCKRVAQKVDLLLEEIADTKDEL